MGDTVLSDRLRARVLRGAAGGLLRKADWSTAVLAGSLGQPRLRLTQAQLEGLGDLLQLEPEGYLVGGRIYRLTPAGSRALAELDR